MTRDSLRSRFRGRDTIFGAWTSLGHPSITEVFSQSAVDFIGIDLEHSTISLEQSQNIIATSQAYGKSCLPRVSSQNPEQIKRLLDSGADGIIVPMVSSVAEAKAMINAFKYAPVGRRSFGIARAQSYGAAFGSYTKIWNERSILIVQIESIEGVRAVDDILDLKEIDGVMIGPYDLSGSLNIPGQLDHPDVVAACRQVNEACKKKGKSCGTQVIDPSSQTVEQALDQGFNFVVLASDVFLLWKWRERMDAIMKSVKPVLIK